MTKFFPVLLILSGLLPLNANANDLTSLVGDWCENGGPYVCYPPIDNKSSTFECTNKTRVTKVFEDKIVFVKQQTIHYYRNGILSGETRPRTIKEVFKRTPNNNATIFEHSETVDDNFETRRLAIKDDTLQVTFKRKADSTDETALLSKIIYQRCSDDPKKKTFYTALVDCGGSGDYIAGVPAVVNNPLLWDLGQDSVVNKTSCQVAARCWGGGWVAYAQSESQNENQKAAFGAACGTANRHDAKQQAINSCRESGGTNCLYNVVSGFDNGSNELDDNAHKGNRVESCSYGRCTKLSSN